MNLFNFLKDSPEKYIIDDFSDLEDLTSNVTMDAKPISESEVENMGNIFPGLDTDKVVVVLDDKDNLVNFTEHYKTMSVGDQQLALRVVNLEDIINEGNLSLCHRILTDNNVKILEDLIDNCVHEVDIKPLKDIRNKVKLKTLEDNILITRFNQIISSIERHNQKLNIMDVKANLAEKEGLFLNMIIDRDIEKDYQDRVIQTLAETVKHHDITIKNQDSSNRNLKLALYVGGSIIFFTIYGVGAALAIVYTGGLAAPAVALSTTQLLSVLGIGAGAGLGWGALTGGAGTAIVKLTK